MEPTSTPPPAPQPPAQQSPALQPAPLLYRRAEVAADAPDNCYRCGYPLLGIDDEQACPECGLLARRSRRTTDELHNTRPRWLARISRGADLILLAILLAAGWPFVWELLGRELYFRIGIGRFGVPLWDAMPWLGTTAAAVLLLAGALLLTSKEGYPPADRVDRMLRWALRFAATVPLLIMAFLALRALSRGWFFMGGGIVVLWWGLWEWLYYLVWALCTIGLAPLPLLLFLHLRGLAKRARSAHLAEHCLIVGIGTSAAIVLLVLYGIVLANAHTLGLGTHWTSRSTVSLLIMLTLAVAGCLFALWSLYLFIRFARAFRGAARELQGRWRNDDLSLPSATPTVAP